MKVVEDVSSFWPFPLLFSEVEGAELAANERRRRCQLAEKESTKKFASLSQQEKDVDLERSD